MKSLSQLKIRQIFLDFFTQSGHKLVAPASLLPANDPSVLFTTAGMQQFKQFYLDPSLTEDKNIVTIQPCLRTSDIESVGDDSHLTFFEMMGNFSFNGYFKEKAIKFSYQLLTQAYNINPEDLFITVFPGDKEIPLDQESIKITRALGIKDQNIRLGDRADNFWGPTGETGPCGPTLEFYFAPKNQPEIEVWNLVFNQYYYTEDKKLISLKHKGIDTGMGLERLTMVLQNKKDIYETDLFSPLMELLSIHFKDSKIIRIMADHIKASIFLMAAGVVPGNKEQGYILKRLLRRALTQLYIKQLPHSIIFEVAEKVLLIYRPVYPEINQQSDHIKRVLEQEINSFTKNIQSGIKKFKQLSINKKLSTQDIFTLYDTYGFPVELSHDLASQKNIKFEAGGLKELVRQHQNKSRSNLGKKFAGGLVEINQQTTKLHTAHHLLLAGLRAILGQSIVQRGSNITSERLRIDFNYPNKIEPIELKKVEAWVNNAIEQNLTVKKYTTTPDQAIKDGALGEFGIRYPAKVTVYTIEPAQSSLPVSREICGGPHVKMTSEVGKIKIIKEESSSAGVRRIKAVLQ